MNRAERRGGEKERGWKGKRRDGMKENEKPERERGVRSIRITCKHNEQFDPNFGLCSMHQHISEYDLSLCNIA